MRIVNRTLKTQVFRKVAELNVAVRLDALPFDLRKPGGLRRSLQTAAEIGAKGVEICARTGIRPSELSDTAVRQLRKMLDDLNLRVVAVRFQPRRGYDNTIDLDRRVDATKQAMKMAYQLGAGVVLNQIGQIPEFVQASADDSDLANEAATTLDPRIDAMRAVLSDLGRFGAHVGAFLAAETGTESGETLEQMLQLDDDAYVATSLNPGQLIINRHGVADAIKSLRGRIHCVAAVDGVLDLAAGRGISVPLGQGIADFPEILAMLEDIQYRGPLIVGRPDTPPETAISELAEAISYMTSVAQL